ncbi:MAG: RluA family pseudouridine synthase [Syntrophobacteraceae bacterium]
MREKTAGEAPGELLSGASPVHLTVQTDESGQRLDFFLSRRFPELSRSHFKKLVREGAARVNGREEKPSYEVAPEDEVRVFLPAREDAEGLTPLPMPLEILYEDEDVVVVNKAPGVVVHPGAGNEQGTLVHGLLAHCGRLALQGAPLRPGIVHRLDRDTSGAIAAAKTEAAYLDLVRQFKEHGVRKEYLALAYGRFTERNGDIRTLIDRHSENRKKMAVTEGRGREAISHWRVEREFGEATFLRVAIETGRTHQIRVHLGYIQRPVVGDATYGGGGGRLRAIRSEPLRRALEKAGRQMLHAHRLAFAHPTTGAPIEVVAPLPPDFAEILEELESIAQTAATP